MLWGKFQKLALHPYSVHLQLSLPIHDKTVIDSKLFDGKEAMLEGRRESDGTGEGRVGSRCV